MKKFFFTFILTVLFIHGLVIAQQKGANISFDHTTFDFGTIDENKGVVTHKFEFTNTGSEPLIIQNATPSCGCTSPSWSNAPVKPGEKGFVTAAFDPTGRPGIQEKTITVNSTANPSVVTLTFKVTVIQKPISLEEQYPNAVGGIRMKSNQILFGTIYKGEQRTNLLEIINASETPQTIKIERVPPYLKVNISPATLAPRQTGIIEVTFNSQSKDDWGFIMDYLFVNLNNSTDNPSYITVSANIEENFNSLTPDQKAKAPVISFDDITYNFGTIKSGETVTHEYKFTNKGKSDLLIRKVVASCGCTAVNSSEQVIAPGKTGVIKASFDSAGKTGQQNKTITVISNDPVSSKIMLWIKAEIADATKADNTIRK
jgi:hypothetical protein